MIKIVSIGSLLSFMKFGGQTSKNVQDVRKLALETCMCDLSVPSMFGYVVSVV